MPIYAGLFCDRCKGVIVTRDIGTCEECGKGTSSGMHKLCPNCAEKLQRCTHCGKEVKDGEAKGS